VKSRKDHPDLEAKVFEKLLLKILLPVVENNILIPSITSGSGRGTPQ
jgi:hypothetical protein